jgi:hypothetical protein
VRKVAATLDPATGNSEARCIAFESLAESFRHSADPVQQSMAKTMAAFAPGLFVGAEDPDLPRDNLDLERFFRLPKGHERRIHGHRHAGVRIVQEGSTLLPALDAHLHHPGLLSCAALRPYAAAPIPKAQQEALCRRKIMRQARSSRRRPFLLKRLEELYQNTS